MAPSGKIRDEDFTNTAYPISAVMLTASFISLVLATSASSTFYKRLSLLSGFCMKVVLVSIAPWAMRNSNAYPDVKTTSASEGERIR